MIKFDWLRISEFGFYCEEGRFYLDPRRSTPRAVISHAHADHYPRYMGEVHAHPATLAMAKTRYKNVAGKTQTPHEFHQPFRLGNIEITLLPAGHMLGSAQIFLKHLERQETILYSGDFALDANPSCKPLIYPKEPVGRLICESTFGKKETHSDADEALEALLEKSKLPILLAAYGIGKAQRVMCHLNKLAPDLPVLVDKSMLPFNRIYDGYKIPIGQYQPYQRKMTKSGRKFVYLIPPRMLSSFKDDNRFYKVFASGWDQKSRFHYLDDRLDISDHASASEIRTYLDSIAPAEVWFWHGYPKELINYCSEKGIPAKAVLGAEI